MVYLDCNGTIIDILSLENRVGRPVGIVDVELVGEEYPSLMTFINYMVILPWFY